MTLQEMARVYRANNEPVRQRLRELRRALRTCRSREEAERLKSRIAELDPICREGRETAVLLERYYGRRRFYGEAEGAPRLAGQRAAGRSGQVAQGPERGQ